MAIARCMVQGCDVWLNTPRRPLEASGTSGMKARPTASLTSARWMAGGTKPGRSAGAARARWAGRSEAVRLTPILLNRTRSSPKPSTNCWNVKLFRASTSAVPTDCRASGFARMKSSIAKLCPVFNMHRMVREYTSEYYLVAHERYLALSQQEACGAKRLASWLDKLEGAWPRLRVESMEDSASEVALGKAVQVSARVFLDVLTPDDVTVEIVTGRVNADGDVTDFFTTPMHASGQNAEAGYRFESEIQPGSRSGLYGYTIRILPKHPDLVSPFLPSRILWECGSGAVPGSREAHYAAAR